MDRARTGRATRRELLAAGLAIPGLAAAGALQGASDAGASPSAPTDAEVVRSTLSVELLAVFCYEHVLAINKLGPAAERAASQFLTHERAHARSLTSELRKLGGSPPATPATVDAASAQLSSLGVPGSLTHLESEHDCLKLLIGLEAVLEGAYYVGLSTLKASLSQTSAEILGVEAQHSTVLNDLLKPGHVDQSVPSAFVEGNY
jgi:hypothetical protein